MSTKSSRPRPERQLLNPATCSECTRLLDIEDLRCVRCGAHRPPGGWVPLPDDPDAADPADSTDTLHDGPPATEEKPRPRPALVEPIRIRIPQAKPDDDAPKRRPQAVLVDGDGEELEEKLEPGSVLAGRYRVQERLDSTGPLQRALAVQEPMVRRVMLLVLNGEDDQLERFLDQASGLTRLKHPGLANAYDFGRAGADRAYLATEVTYGLELREVLNWGPLPPSRLRPVVRQLTEAVAELHKAGLIHGDLRPDHMVLESTSAGREQLRISGLGHGSTKLGPSSGDPYLAPELKAGGLPTKASDVYALGVVLYQSLFGCLPDEDRERTDPGVTISDGLRPVLQRCLLPSNERYPTALAVLEDLIEVAPPPAPAAPPPVVMPPPTIAPAVAQTRSLLLVAGASAGIGAVVATGMFLILNSMQPPQVREVQVPVPVEVPVEVPVAAPAAADPTEEGAVTEDAGPTEDAESAEEVTIPWAPDQGGADEQPDEAPEPAAARPAPKPKPAAPSPAAERPAPKPAVAEAPTPSGEPASSDDGPTEAGSADEPADADEAEPAVAEAPEPEPEPEPPPPPTYPDAPQLTGLWIGKSGRDTFVLDLNVDGEGRVSGGARLVDRSDDVTQGGVRGQVRPTGDTWILELTWGSTEGVMTLSGELRGTEGSGRMFQAGDSKGRWSVVRG